MAENSAIEWTDHTFNPWSGCTKVAPGCKNCYAEVNMSVKLRGVKWGPNGNRVRASDAMWRQPLKWDRQAEKEGVRRRVFCASLADVFEEWDGPILNHEGERMCFYEPRNGWLTTPVYMDEAPPGSRFATMDDMRRDLFQCIDLTPNLDWLLLTKRPENVRDGRHWKRRENVWLGTSVSEQATADRNIQHLLACRDLCPVLFVSAEPLLGAIDLAQLWLPDRTGFWNALDGKLTAKCTSTIAGQPDFWVKTENPIKEPIDWLIIGGESGPKARPCNIAHVRSLVRQCKAAGVACFAKQLGSQPTLPYYDQDMRDWALDRQPNMLGVTCPIHGEHLPGDAWQPGPGAWIDVGLRDPKGGDMSEWPEDLRVREFPTKTHKETIHA